MEKATHYLLQTKEMNLEEVEKQKEYWRSLGYRVVIFRDGKGSETINKALIAVIENHMKPMV